MRSIAVRITVQTAVTDLTLPPAQRQEERTRFSTDARLTYTETESRISYAEGEEAGMGNTQTEFTVSHAPEGAILLHRTGDVACELVFSRKNRRRKCLYRTPVGDMQFTVITRSIQKELTAIGGTIEMDYCMEANGALLQRVRVKMTVRPKAGEEQCNEAHGD